MSGVRERMARLVFIAIAASAPLTAPAQDASTSDANDHVAPPAAAQPMPPMSDAQMERIMDMHDDPLLAMLKLDQFERAFGRRSDAAAWEGDAWIGHDFDKLWLRSEGQRDSGRTDARIEAFWDHAFASFWDWQLGVRRDLGSGPGRTWAAFGVQGLAPYWFEVEATAYVGEAGRTALRLRSRYELLLTQRLILQPELAANAYGRRDASRAIEAGIDDVELGARLRYEIRREFAPYIGIVRRWRGGELPHAGDDTQIVAGVRVWF